MNLTQVFLIFAFIVGCSWAAEVSTNPSSSHFFNRKLLKHMKSYIDVEANPCEDLYQYACGKWSEQNGITEDEGDYTSAVEKVNYEINLELAQYMNAMSLRNKPEFVQKAHSFYKSCVGVKVKVTKGDKKEKEDETDKEEDDEKDEKEDEEDTEDTEDDDYYDMLFFMNWMAEHENMTWALLTPAEKANHTFDWVHTLAMMRRYGMNGVFIEEGKYERYDGSRKTVIDLDKANVYEDFTALTYDDLVALSKVVTLPTDVVPLEELWQEINEFEESLVEVYDLEDAEDTKYITVKDLPLAWMLKYLGIILDETSLNLNMKIRIQNIPYMEALHELLKGHDDEFICKYLEVRFLWYLRQMPQTFTDTDCVDATRGMLSLSMNWIYEQQHPELEEEIPKIHEIFDNIIGYVRQTMHSDKSGIVNEVFLDTLDNMQLKVGNLPRIDTIKVLDSFYANLTLNASDFYGNLLKLSEFNFNASHSGYGNFLTTNLSQLFYVDSYADGSSYLPYYLSTPNVVVAPLSVMRQPFYHWGYDNVYKYSSLGTRFAFVIIQGVFNFFDTNDIMNKDIDKISHIASLHSAYEAHHSFLPEHLKEETFIKGTQLIFFLNYAQHYCDADEPLDLNPYVSHFPEFAEAFDCKLRNFVETLVNLPNKEKK